MILQRLRGLIVSIQPEPESVLNTPETIALLARCAVANGASGVRIEGAVRIAAVRAAVNVPIIGLVKRVYPGYDPYITPTRGEVEAIAKVCLRDQNRSLHIAVVCVSRLACADEPPLVGIGRNGHSLDVPAALYASDDFERQVFEFLRSLPFFLRHP